MVKAFGEYLTLSDLKIQRQNSSLKKKKINKSDNNNNKNNQESLVFVRVLYIFRLELCTIFLLLNNLLETILTYLFRYGMGFGKYLLVYYIDLRYTIRNSKQNNFSFPFYFMWVSEFCFRSSCLLYRLIR